MIALFWDVDGTLLSTARAGIFSLEDALEHVTGVREDLHGMATAGMTDYAIAEAAIAAVGHQADDATVMEFLRAHGEQLPAYLGRRQGHVMPNVREILEDLAPRDDVESFLLTGNTETGAQAKLAHYGLAGFFTRGGAFCVGAGTRDDIARAALPFAEGADAHYVIGDTPADIACGAAIGARTIAVATGSYSVDELAVHEPWAVLAELPPPDEFRELVSR